MKTAFFLLIVATCILFLFMMYPRKKDKESSNSLLIGLGGDTMLGRLVNETIAETSYAYPWGNVLPELKKTDINLINLETTLTTHTTPVPKVFNFRAEPDRVQTLIEGNITVVSLANNHILDFGIPGLEETITILDGAGIKHVGAGSNQHEAQRPVVLEKNGIKIGIIGATDNEPSWNATPNTPGTFYFEVDHPQPVLYAISQLKLQVDLVIVSLHWGPNMRQRPTQKFKRCAHQFIDAGADIIHGHSAHIFQGIELYKQKIILYDTGDFVDDYAVDPVLKNNQSLFFTISLKKENGKTALRTLKLTPLLISNMQVNKATGTERQEILEKLTHLSNELGPLVFDSNIVSISDD